MISTTENLFPGFWFALLFYFCIFEEAIILKTALVGWMKATCVLYLGLIWHRRLQ
jgi:hypothetical protein